MAALRPLGGACKKLRRIWVDGGYRGQLLDWVAERFRFRLQVLLRPEERKDLVQLPRRWAALTPSPRNATMNMHPAAS